MQHAGQQAGDREVVRSEAARPGRRRHLHDLRRRLRRSGRPGGDQRREADGRNVHRHRSDGPEALRSEGAPRVLVRQRRAGRGLGDGGVRLEDAAGETRRSRRTRSIIYFRNVVQAFEARWKQLGGKVVTKETYQSAGGNPASWQSVVTRLNAKQADVIVTSTAPPFGAQVPIMNGLRTLGNNTPILNSWAGDGNYWYTQDPKISNYYYVTFASAFGDDPVPAVKALAKRNAAAIAKAGSTGRLRHGACGDRRHPRSRSSARAGTRTDARSRRRWRSSRTCPRCPGS